ncbi:hypothetical protein TWF970_010217 [Orbilia oligospora]|uniref:YhhN domain-containing protein n=1 Tax=Orbilia oligospora TaxID=2813651 RepID=A0A7C8VGD9_ORBOL|nr:hypothetical protein TWF970_010217 [Orbilia oligospora]
MPTLSTLITPLALLSLSLPSLILSESRAIYLGSAIFKLTASSAFVWRSLLSSPSSTPLDPSVLAAKWWITFSLISGLIGDFCLIPSKKSYYNPSGGHEGDSIWFKLGMLAFMINHAGYIGAFLQFIKGGVMENIDWKIFGGVFIVCIILGDLCDLSNQKAFKKGPRHTRSDSGVTDLSISIPSTPKSGSNNNSPTTSTPLLSSTTTSSTTIGGIIPKMAIPSDMKPLIIIYQLIITTMVASAAGTRGALSERLLGAFMFMVSDVMVAWDTFGIKPVTPVSASTKAEERVVKSRQGWKSRGFGWVLYFGGQYILAAYGAK